VYFAIQEIIPRHFRTSHGRFPVRWESQNLWYFKMERCSENPPLILLHQLPLGNNRLPLVTTMSNLGIDTIPKEVFFLMTAAIGLVGAVLGFAGAMIATLINRRTQRKLTRETHQQQYEIEELKVHALVEREDHVYLRSKIEEAHQLLSKVAVENSEEACHIMLDQGVTETEYHTRYLQQRVELQRLEMLVALYFPILREQTQDLWGLTSQFWGQQKYLIVHKDEFETIRTSHLPMRELLEQEPYVALSKLQELAGEIGGGVERAKRQLQGLIYDAIPSSFK